MENQAKLRVMSQSEILEEQKKLLSQLGKPQKSGNIIVKTPDFLNEVSIICKHIFLHVRLFY